MKTLATLSFAFIASAAFAGQPMVMTDTSKKGPVPMEPCFHDQEIQLDVFGTFVASSGAAEYQDGFGGGLGINYYFHRNIGFGVDGQVTSADDGQPLWQFTGNVLLRYPVDTGTFCFAPYAKLGAGYQMDGNGDFIYGGMLGIEFRLNERIGVFGEGGYYWSDEDSNDSAIARVGVRFVF